MRTFLWRFWVFTGYFLAFVFLIMSLACSYRHASLGLDLEEKSPPTLLATYYRLNWPGNGTLTIGGSSKRISEAGHKFEAYDIGGTFNDPPTEGTPHFLGFGAKDSVWEDDYNKSHPDAPKLWSRWLCIPAFLPALLFGLGAFFLARKSPKP
jgi:hypothetical protein